MGNNMDLEYPKMCIRDRHWDYWAEIENVILVGGLANERFGKIMLECIEEVFELEEKDVYKRQRWYR